MTTFYSVELMTVYEMKLMCKKMKLKRYSRLRKKDLKQFLKDHIDVEQREKQMKQLETDNIFCYPDILKEIYSYVDYDNTKTIRKEMIQKSFEKREKCIILLDKYKLLKSRIERKTFLRQNLYTSIWSLREELNRCIALRYSLDELKKQRKETLYIWLKTLKYKVVRKMLKKDMLLMVIKSYEEIIY